MTTTNGDAPLVIPKLPLYQRIVAIAQDVVGIDASTGLDRFCDLLEPVMFGTSRSEIRRILGLPFGRGGISTCGLVASGIQYRAGYDPDELSTPWSGRAVSRIVSYLRRAGAWTAPQWDGAPPLGSVVLIGHNTDRTWGGVEHVLTVVGLDGDVVESIDGGQVDGKGLQAIRTVRRRLTVRGNGQVWLVGLLGDPARAPGRRVQGWGVPR